MPNVSGNNKITKNIMRIIKYLIVLFFIVNITENLFAHGEHNFAWTTVNTSGIYDFKNERLLQSFDINSSFVVINGGLSYKNLDYIESKKISTYIGLGMGSIIQIQAGFSKDGFSLRYRTDWILGFASDNFAKKHPYFGLTTFTIITEKYFNNSQMKWYLGLGIGISINNIYGIKVFKQ